MEELNIPQEDLNKWLAALRSGEYKQGQGHLEQDNTFCCLGVACKILVNDPRIRENGELFGGLISSHPTAPQWLQEIDEVVFAKLGKGLMGLNDNVGLTFDEIADVIELIFIHKAI